MKRKVTPLVGVWIETWEMPLTLQFNHVTPLVGVWIETKNFDDKINSAKKSHLS